MKKRICRSLAIYIVITFASPLLALNSRGQYLSGNDYLKKGLYPLAIEAYKKAIELNPYYKEAYHGLGKAYYGQELYKEAEASLNKAIELDTNYWQAYNDLALLYEHQGHLDKARENYEKALKISPQIAELHFNLARILTEENRLPSAIEEYKKVIRIDTGYIQAYVNLGDLYSRLGDLDRAAAYYKEAQRRNPGSAHVNLGDLYWRRGWDERAVSEYRKASAVLQDKTRALNRLSNIYIERKELDEAIKINREIIKISPKSAIAHYSLGLAYEIKGDLTEARKGYEEALSIDPYDQVARYHLEDLLLRVEPAASVIRREYARYRLESGNQYSLENNRALAAYAYKRAILLSPQDPSPRMRLAELYRREQLINETLNELVKVRDLDPADKDAMLRLEQTYRLLERSISRREAIDPASVPPSGVRLLLIKLSGGIVGHPGITDQMDEVLTFILGQFPQVSIIPDKSRDTAMKKLGIEKMGRIEDLFGVGKEVGAQYVFWAEITEGMDKIEVKARLVDLATLTDVEKNLFSSTNDRLETLPLKMAISIIENVPLEGVVVKIKPQEAIINLGVRHGLKIGAKLNVFRQGEPRKDLSGEPCESRQLIGQIEVTSIENTLAKGRILTYGLYERLKMYDLVSLVKEK